jgi:proline iminopeptidase
VIVSVDGAELHYTTQGRGTPCLLPTAIGTEPYERQTAGPLCERLRLVYVDLRGGGRSSGNPADLDSDVIASDFEAVRTALGVERIAVLGHSIVGMLAIEYARRHPAHVSHVIAVGTPARGDMAALAARASAFFEKDGSTERKRVLQENLAAIGPGADPSQAMLAQTPTRFFDPRFDAAPLFAGATTNPLLLGHLLGRIARTWDVTNGANPLRVPMLLAHGRYDYTVPYLDWEELAATLPRATLEIFERSGHQPFAEEPERFARVVTDWMEREA